MPGGSNQSVKVCTESTHLSDMSANSRQWDQMGNKRCNSIALYQSQTKQEKKLITYYSLMCYPANSSNVKFPL